MADKVPVYLTVRASGATSVLLPTGEIRSGAILSGSIGFQCATCGASIWGSCPVCIGNKLEWIYGSVPFDRLVPLAIMADWLEENGRLADAAYVRKVAENKQRVQ